MDKVRSAFGSWSDVNFLMSRGFLQRGPGADWEEVRVLNALSRALLFPLDGHAVLLTSSQQMCIIGADRFSLPGLTEFKTAHRPAAAPNRDTYRL